MNHDPIDLPSDNNGETSAGGSDERIFFELEEYAFQLWIDGTTNEATLAMKSILQKFFDLWNHRVSTTVRYTFLIELSRIFSLHGVPYVYKAVKKNNIHVNKRTEFNYKYIPSRNVAKFFRDISHFEGRCRTAMWCHSRLGTFAVGEDRKRVLTEETVRLRYQLYVATRSRNFRAVAANLAYLEPFRMVTEKVREKTPHRAVKLICWQKTLAFDGPIYGQCALQTVISTKRDYRVDIGLRIFHLAYAQSQIYTNDHIKNSILGQLSEFLTTAIAQGHLEAAEKISQLGSLVHVHNKHKEYLLPWNAYRLLLRFEKWRRGEVGGATLESLADELEEQMYALDKGSHSTVFTDAAIRIRAKLSRNEQKVSELVSNCVEQNPQLIGRLTRILKAERLREEVVSAIDEACSPLDTPVHGSDVVWLEWCKPRIERPHSFGFIQEVLSRCLSVLFSFLDFSSNRNSDLAWRLLWRLVQQVEKESILPMWIDRSSWWPRFHVSPLSDVASQCRRDVLLALQTELPVL